jgi:hypothetical protein
MGTYINEHITEILIGFAIIVVVGGAYGLWRSYSVDSPENKQPKD